MSGLEKHEPDPVIVDAEIVRDGVYADERKALADLLTACLAKNEPLRVHERSVLSQDEIYVVLQKIKHALSFSRKEHNALTDVGFLVDKLYPDL